MSFVLKKVDYYKWPVTIRVPEEGDYLESTFNVIFKVLKKSEIQALANDDAKFLKSIVLGWEDMENEDGSEYKFTKSHLDEMIEDFRWSVGVVRTYYESFNEAMEKN